MSREARHAGLEPGSHFEAFTFEESVEPVAVELLSSQGNPGKLVLSGVAAGALESLDGAAGIFVRNEAAKRGVVFIAINVLEGEEGLFLIDTETEFRGVSFFFGKTAFFKPLGVPHVLQAGSGELIFHTFTGGMTAGASLGDDGFAFHGISGSCFDRPWCLGLNRGRDVCCFLR